MAIPVALALGALGGLLLLLGSAATANAAEPGAKEPDEGTDYKPVTSLGKQAEQAAQAKDWQAAVAGAVAAFKSSGDRQAVLAVMKLLKAAGKTKEYLALGEVLSAESAAVQKARKEAPSLKPKASAPAPAAPAPVPAPSPAKPKPKAPAKPKPKAPAKPKPVSPAPAPAKPAPVSPEQKQAADLAEMLRGSMKYRENQAQVRDYQSANYLDPDGLYGPATAKTLWLQHAVVPPNPFYWPKGKETDAKAQYALFLDSVARDVPETAATVARLKAAL